MAENPNNNWGTGSTGSSGTEFTGTSGTGFGTGSPGSNSGMGTGSPYGVTSATDRGTDSNFDSSTGVCSHCGQSLNRGGLEQFLGHLGVSDEMINNLKTQFHNVDVDEYLNIARDYLKDSSGKATTYAKENPGKVAAGVAALALGAGLIFAATRDR
jgi:hypothetical protein